MLVDIDKETLNIDETKLKKLKKTKAMIIVHFAGLPCNINNEDSEKI